MDPGVGVDVLEREAAAFAELLATVPLDAPIPSCPGWALGDLARHLGGVHRWARHAVLVGPSEEPVGPTDPQELEPWFREGAQALVSTLRTVDPDQPCWTFAPPGSVRFWVRRQAHETTMHGWDAAMACGAARGIDTDIATDGIDEVVTMFVPRQVRLGRLAPTPGSIELSTPSGFRTVLRTDPREPESEPSVRITGPADALLLLLWRRTTPDDPRLTVTGEAADAARLLASPLTP